MSNDFENSVAILAQKYLADNPLVILGSGASAGYGLPTMQMLSKKLICELKEILSGDETWKAFSKNLSKHGDLERTLQEIRLSPDAEQMMLRKIWSIISDADLAVIEKLRNHELELAQTILFKKLLQAHPRNIEVITTNYDRLAEYAADQAGAEVYDGFVGRFIRLFSGSLHPYRKGIKIVQIWKVHGSIEWFEDQNGFPVAYPMQSSLPKHLRPMIVTPGVAKYQETHRDPYRTVISKADSAIIQASCYLCLGYGFNDDHLQEKLVQQIHRENKPVVLLTKCATERAKELVAGGKAKKYLIVEEKEEDTSLVTANNLNGLMKGKYWQLDKFVSLWLGE